MPYFLAGVASEYDKMKAENERLARQLASARRSLQAEAEAMARTQAIQIVDSLRHTVSNPVTQAVSLGRKQAEDALLSGPPRATAGFSTLTTSFASTVPSPRATPKPRHMEEAKPSGSAKKKATKMTRKGSRSRQRRGAVMSPMMTSGHEEDGAEMMDHAEMPSMMAYCGPDVGVVVNGADQSFAGEPRDSHVAKYIEGLSRGVTREVAKPEDRFHNAHAKPAPRKESSVRFSVLPKSQAPSSNERRKGSASAGDGSPFDIKDELDDCGLSGADWLDAAMQDALRSPFDKSDGQESSEGFMFPTDLLDVTQEQVHVTREHKSSITSSYYDSNLSFDMRPCHFDRSRLHTESMTVGGPSFGLEGHLGPIVGATDSFRSSEYGDEPIARYRTQVRLMGTQETLFAVGFAADNTRLRKASVFDTNGNLMKEEAELIGLLHHVGANWSVIEFFGEWWDWYKELTPPPPTTFVARLVNSYAFEIAIAVLILANAFFAVVGANAKAANAYSQDFVNAEILFTVIFVLEMVLRLTANRLWFFFTGPDFWWNVIDLIILVLTLVPYLSTPSRLNPRYKDPTWVTHVSWSFLRVVRLLKANRLAVMLNQVRSLRDLRLMLQLLLQCLSPAFLWCVFSVFFAMYIVALFLVQKAAVKLHDLDSGSEKYDTLDAHFGTFQRATLTLFKATSGGDDWGNILEVVELFDSGWSKTLLILFIVFFQFALFNVVTGIFVEKAMTSAELTDEEKMKQNREKELKYARELLTIVRALDLDGSGTIGYTEFVTRMNMQPSFRSAFSERGLNIKNPRTFFKMLASIYNSDNIPLSDFVSACMRLRGEASCLDVRILDFELKLILTNQLKFHSFMKNELHAYQQMLMQAMATGYTPEARE